MAEDFVPMSNEQRWVEAVKGVVGPSVFFDTAVRAGIEQAADRPEAWGGKWDGFAKRLGNAYGEQFIDEALKDPIAFALHEDNRYFASGKRGFGPRLAYVLDSAVMARHDDGSRSVSVSALAGAASAALISRAWQPRGTSTAGNAAVTFGLILGVHALRDGLYEFAPRAFRRFLR